MKGQKLFFGIAEKVGFEQQPNFRLSEFSRIGGSPFGSILDSVLGSPRRSLLSQNLEVVLVRWVWFR
jgi:hypothetical protein